MTNAKANRLDRILDYLEHGAFGPVSRADIAKAVGLEKSPYLYNLLQRLLDDGHIAVTTTEGPNGKPMYLYIATRYLEAVEADTHAE